MPNPTMPTASSGYVCLRGGLCVPVDAVLLQLELESRGFRLTPDGEQLIVQPGSQLTPDDRARITTWKWHLLALVDYRAPECA